MVHLNKILSLLPTWPSCCSVRQLCLTLWNSRLPCPSLSPGLYSNPCLLSHQFYSTISSSVTPSLPALSLSQNQGLFFSSVSALHIKCTKYWLRTYYTLTILMALQGLYHLILSTCLWNVYCCYRSSLSEKFCNKLINFPKSQLMLNAGKNFSSGIFSLWWTSGSADKESTCNVGRPGFHCWVGKIL